MIDSDEHQESVETNSVGAAGAYGHAGYVGALEHIGRAVHLASSGSFFLERDWLDGADACGPYPLLTCTDWSLLAAELELHSDRWASATAISDPMAEVKLGTLQETFPDLCMSYKDHFVLDLEKPIEDSISNHHRRKWHRGRKRVRIEHCANSAQWGTEWASLYEGLIHKHAITGPAAFPAGSLQAQLGLPGVFVQRALIEDRTVSMVVWYMRGEGVSYHLAATNDEGYEASATYALFADAFQTFRERGVAWAHLGAGAGVQADSNSGLSAFKSGWSTHTKTAYLCGRILQPKVYARWCANEGTEPRGDFFPQYRAAPKTD